jgi:membrane-bound lytic murein transglycosylase A
MPAPPPIIPGRWVSLPVLLFLFLLLFPPCPGYARESALLLPPPGEVPPLIDDMDKQSLMVAATRHLGYLRGLPSTASPQAEDQFCSRECLLESMETFLQILKQNLDPAALDQAVRENFIVYQAGGRNKSKNGEMLITGYYEPLFDGSLTRKGDFIHPLYAQPGGLITYQDARTGKKSTGRVNDSGDKVPFWSRAEIEKENLLAGCELVYLKDPVDSFVLHVQGSGKIRLPNGSRRAIQFAATNGLEYKSIGKLLVDEKKMSCEEATMPTIRQYLQENPEDRQRILHHNPRFVFFRWNDTNDSPTGSIGLPLTPGRSIAVDPKTLPTGAMAYLISRKPVLNQQGQLERWETLRRFVLPQDTGSAIKGAGRADLFLGNGHYAEVAAGNMKEEGYLYFLVKKGSKNGEADSQMAAKLPDLP